VTKEIEDLIKFYQNTTDVMNKETYGCQLVEAIWRAVNYPKIYGDCAALLADMPPATRALYEECRAEAPGHVTKEWLKARRRDGHKFAECYINNVPQQSTLFA